MTMSSSQEGRPYRAYGIVRSRICIFRGLRDPPPRYLVAKLTRTVSSSMKGSEYASSDMKGTTVHHPGVIRSAMGGKNSSS